MDHNGMLVHHGLATMASIGLMGVMSFGSIKEEGSGGILTKVEIGRFDIGVRPAAKRSKQRQWRSVIYGFGAQRGGEKGSMRCFEA
jgi:hypothetical protein